MLQDSRSACAKLEGVAIACFINHWGGLHVTFLYKREDDTTWLCDVAWNLVSRNEPVDEAADLCWVNINKRPEILDFVAEALQLMGQNFGLIPYDVRFSAEEDYFDPTTWSYKREMPGLTCATFIMAVLKNFKLNLFSVPTWPGRSEDRPALEHLISELEMRGVDSKRIEEMRLNHDNIRFRPEEVCGSVSEANWPVPFEIAQQLGTTLATTVRARQPAKPASDE